MSIPPQFGLVVQALRQALSKLFRRARRKDGGSSLSWPFVGDGFPDAIQEMQEFQMIAKKLDVDLTLLEIGKRKISRLSSAI
jgi:hypothetical protein